MPPQTRPVPVAKGAKKEGEKRPVKKAQKSATNDSSAPVAQHALISERIERAQALKAFKALSAYVARVRAERSANELPLDGPGSEGASRDTENAVWMQITLKELNTQRKVKPATIPLAHALLDSSASVCLLTKDPQREYKDLLVEKNIKSISRVVGVEKLRGKFKPFDARRELVRDHDLFLADERIVPMLPKLCGNVFFDARKFPVPVDIEHRNRLKASIERAIASTYYLQNKGSCSTIKIGFLNRHTPEQLVENLATALPAVVAKIPGKWSNVQNIEVKTGRSAALPIWNTSLGKGADSRWAPVEREDAKRKREELVEDNEDDEDIDDESDDDEPESEEEAQVPPPKPVKSKPAKAAAATEAAPAKVKSKTQMQTQTQSKTKTDSAKPVSTKVKTQAKTADAPKPAASTKAKAQAKAADAPPKSAGAKVKTQAKTQAKKRARV
ncbi:proteasome-interacting protein cic1 [Malassezia cuniculi]|uniref:Ribosomal L1 domain-containing protein 1 n=1 Tax=Malassezia cuniculi TaxID=948313 RepID=A0AAF0ESJ3_9BASI|nr:proteasome-interacting protein cic1 [Malassezia cuniculi]